MRIYCLSYYDGVDNQQEWFGSKRNAQKRETKIKHEYGNDLSDHVFNYNIPTDKQGLINWLNIHFSKETK